MKLLICTFNMGDRPFTDDEQIRKMFRLTADQLPDLVAVGLQESHSKAPQQLLKYFVINDYLLFADHTMQATKLMCFCRAALKPKVKSVVSAQCETRNGGVGARNKGGIAVSFQFEDVSLCLVTAHLASFRRYLAERNADAVEILHMVHKDLRSKTDKDWDHMFVFGDLNYRSNALTDEEEVRHLLRPVDADEDANAQRAENRNTDHSSAEREIVNEWIRTENWQEFRHHCQLREQLLAAGNGEKRAPFSGFQETSVFPFPPTFKLEPHSDPPKYDSKRLPSYCDRVLWKSSDPTRMKQVSYDSPSEVDFSDHRPVVSLFEIR